MLKGSRALSNRKATAKSWSFIVLSNPFLALDSESDWVLGWEIRDKNQNFIFLYALWFLYIYATYKTKDEDL